MSSTSILCTCDEEAWALVLARIGIFDFYHLPAYHRLAEELGEGTAKLFVYEENEFVVALPLMLREVATVEGLAENKGALGWRDATSVYGYAGPVVNPLYLDSARLSRFQHALKEWLVEERVVALFSRLHPLLNQKPLLGQLGTVAVAGETLSIDLTLARDEQVARYRKSHRNEINRAVRLGVTCHYDRKREWLTEFVAIYRETMRRVDASAYYLFDDDYFSRLFNTPALDMNLFMAFLAEKPIAGAIFARCGTIAQYHLAGTEQSYTRLAPMKLIVDTARNWAVDSGVQTLHLGGGVGSARDSLFQFKAGFGGSTLPFYLWRWETNPAVYASLVAIRQAWEDAHAKVVASADFFPRYRAPVM